MKKIKSFISDKRVISFIFSTIIFSALCFQGILVPYNFLSILLYVIIYFFIYSIDLNNIYKKDIIVMSSIFSLMLVVGRELYAFRYDSTISIINEIFKLKSLIYFVGYGLLIYSILSLIVPKILNYKSKKTKRINKLFLLSFLVIIVCYVQYLIVFFPGILTGDSLSEIRMIVNTLPVSDHHTVFHYLFMLIPFKIGDLLFNNPNIAVGLISMTQIIVMALTFSYVIYFLNKRNISNMVLLAILLIYALLPVNGFYSITMWKDIIFSCSVVLLTIECYKLIERKNITMKNSYIFILTSLLVLFTRNNAIYMYIILALVSIIVFRKKLIVIIPALAIIFTFYFVIKGPIYTLIGIEKSSSSEYLAIPLQQIGRMAYKEVYFSEKEQKAINDVIPLEELKNSYNPEIVDPIKFNSKYNSKVIEKNKMKYLKLWLNLCYKYPKIAVESYLISTLGYWYPGTEYWVTTAKIDENELGIYNCSPIPESIRNKIISLTSNDIPLIGFLNCVGLYIWLTILLAYILLKKNGKKILYIFVPVFGIWLTMLVATPVFSEFRYTYSFVLTVPLFLGLIFVNNNSKNDNKNRM